jgi:hypothetical protein
MYVPAVVGALKCVPTYNVPVETAVTFSVVPDIEPVNEVEPSLDTPPAPPFVFTVAAPVPPEPISRATL